MASLHFQWLTGPLKTKAGNGFDQLELKRERERESDRLANFTPPTLDLSIATHSQVRCSGILARAIPAKWAA